MYREKSIPSSEVYLSPEEGEEFYMYMKRKLPHRKEEKRELRLLQKEAKTFLS